MVNDRYIILRQLDQGKFGRTYLAEDRHRFNELCILQAFSPDIDDPKALEKTQELFQRKAQILYTLNHPQIPCFRELFSGKHQGKVSLFLVQDYIQGSTYRQLLQQRLSQGQVFSEKEVAQLLLNILPVFDYLHQKGFMHRDLTPHSLLRRDSDGLPILISFGSVKQLSAIATTYFQKTELLTEQIIQIGQLGYAPPEQINRGLVSASSDLYGLGATALVLLTGKEPSQLLDQNTLTWHLPPELSLSSSLTSILLKMLAKDPSDRYPSAQAAINDLTLIKPQPTTPATVIVNPMRPNSTIVPQISQPAISRPSTSEIQTNMILTSGNQSRKFGCLSKLFLGFMLIIGSGILGWGVGKIWIVQTLDREKNQANIKIFPSDKPTQMISDQELERKTELRNRRRQLAIDHSLFVAIVDEIFVNQNPSQKGRILSNSKDDSTWREKWDQVAANVLDILESLDKEALQGMGNYSQTQRTRWKSQANHLHLSSRALYDLVDGQFFAAFPEQVDQNFIEKPIGQVWHAMVLDTLTKLTSGDAYENLSLSSEFSSIQRKKRLQPGEGQSYILQLNEEETIEAKLQGDRNLLLSIYSPTGNNNLLEDSKQHQWSGKLPESGYYEFTIVSQSNKPANYKLKITIVQE
ncbi:MAG: serine/threonine-protein kinase [Cyanobacteria bacterium P01_G01_bin.49]